MKSIRVREKSVCVPPSLYALLRGIADTEQRTLRAVMERSLRLYAVKHAPEVLKKLKEAA